MTGEHTFTPEDGLSRRRISLSGDSHADIITKSFRRSGIPLRQRPHKALEVSKALSLQKSSVHRFLNSLIEFGYVRKDDQTGLFSVTLKVVQLGAMVSSKIDMVETGRSYMRELVATFDQATVSFATFMDKQVLVTAPRIPRNCVTRIDLSQRLPPIARGSARLSSRRKAKRKSTNTSPPSRGRPTPCIP